MKKDVEQLLILLACIVFIIFACIQTDGIYPLLSGIVFYIFMMLAEQRHKDRYGK